MKELINPVEITIDNHTINIDFINQFDEKLFNRNVKLHEKYINDLHIVVKQCVHAPRKNGLTRRMQDGINKVTRDYIHRESDFLLVLSEVSKSL